MSKLISTYAAATGLRIASKADLLTQFAPLPFTTYITLQTGAGQAAKCYDYWQEVLILLAPYLGPKGINVVHLGAKDDPPLQGVYDLRAKTTIAQSHHVIQNAIAHLGGDSWLAHCAGWNRKPLVALYGSTSVQNHGPYWFDAAKTILLSSHRGGGVPSYSAQENPKTINWIAPETVANAVLAVLGIPERITHQTRLIGMLYSHVLFDVVPDSFPSPDFLPEVAMTVRMDLKHDEHVLANLLMTGRKVNIMTKRPIDLALLHRFKASILSYNHEVDDACPVIYAGQIGSIIRNHSFFTKEVDEDKVAALRFRFFDVCVVQRASNVSRDDYLTAALTYINQKGDDARRVLEGEMGRLSFKTNHYLLSEGKVFLSTAHWKAGQSAQDLAHNAGPVIDSPDFWVDTNHMLIAHNPAPSS